MPNTALDLPQSREEFLRWEERQQGRYEFVGGIVRLMAGGTEAHDAIASNIIGLCYAALRGGPCRIHGSNLKVLSPVEDGVMYPDAFVRCGPAIGDRTTCDDPVVVFEVLSGSTSQHDLGRKKRAYQAIPSLRQIVYVSTEEPLVILMERDGSGQWREDTVEGIVSTLALPSIGLETTLVDLYEGTGIDDRRLRPLSIG